MDSLNSACSFAKSTPVPLDQFQQDVEPLLGRQVRVALVVGPLSIFKTPEDLNDAVHDSTFITVTYRKV